MTFRPLHDRVLVRRIEADQKTAGGIIIPDTAKEKPQQGGEIVAVGPGARNEKSELVTLDVKAGDRSAVRQMIGHGSAYRRRRPSDHEGKADILGVLEEGEAQQKAA